MKLPKGTTAGAARDTRWFVDLGETRMFARNLCVLAGIVRSLHPTARRTRKPGEVLFEHERGVIVIRRFKHSVMLYVVEQDGGGLLLREQLTADRVVTIGFTGASNKRWYRPGWVAPYTPSETIEGFLAAAGYSNVQVSATGVLITAVPPRRRRAS